MKILALSIGGLALGILSVHLAASQMKAPPTRQVASAGGIRPAKIRLGKLATALTVELAGPSTIPEDSAEVVELVGTITQNIEGDSGIIDYKWSLPPGVELVRGPLVSTLSETALGQPREVNILVKGFSRAKQKLVSLSCQLQKAGQELTASAVIVSRPEDTAETRMMDLSAQAMAAGQAASEAGAAAVTK
jgi:hypothetical protein